MDTPICANDAAEMASITNANNSERMEWVIRIVQSFGRFILRLARWCSTAAGCVDGEAHFRTKRTAHASLANGSVMNFLISGVLSLIKNAQFDLTFCGFTRLRLKACCSKWAVPLVCHEVRPTRSANI